MSATTAGGKRDSLLEGKVTSRRSSNKPTPRGKAQRATVGAGLLKEGGPGDRLPLRALSAASPKDKHLPKKGAKQNEKGAGPPSDRKSIEGADEVPGEEIPVAPRSEEAPSEGPPAAPSPPRGSLLALLQEENRKLARESVTLRRALLRHISNEELLALLASIAADPSGGSAIRRLSSRAPWEPLPGRPPQEEPGRRRHLYDPCVKKFFEVLSCCVGGPPSEVPSPVAEEPPVVIPVPPREGPRPERTPKPDATKKRHKEKQKAPENGPPIAVDFFPLGPLGEEAAIQTEPLMIEAQQEQPAGKQTPNVTAVAAASVAAFAVVAAAHLLQPLLLFSLLQRRPPALLLWKGRPRHPRGPRRGPRLPPPLVYRLPSGLVRGLPRGLQRKGSLGPCLRIMM